MSDSRYASLKKLTKYPLALARKRKVLFFIGSCLFASFMAMYLAEPVFTHTQIYVIALLFLAISLWVTEAIPPFSVGILIIGCLVLIMGTDAAQSHTKYLQTWSDNIIWLFLGGFFLAEAMKKTKLDIPLVLNHLH